MEWSNTMKQAHPQNGHELQRQAQERANRQFSYYDDVHMPAMTKKRDDVVPKNALDVVTPPELLRNRLKSTEEPTAEPEPPPSAPATAAPQTKSPPHASGDFAADGSVIL